jgi:hypothetical protein
MKLLNDKTFNKNTLFRFFLIKYILIYNIYGNIFLGGSLAIILIIINIYNIYAHEKYFLILLILSVIVSIYTLTKGLLITLSFKKKWKYFYITIKRIKSKGYNDNYFSMSMYEPCMRVISKDVLNIFSLSENYSKLKTKYGNEDPYIKASKEKLIRGLKQKDAGNIKFN